MEYFHHHQLTGAHHKHLPCFSIHSEKSVCMYLCIYTHIYIYIYIYGQNIQKVNAVWITDISEISNYTHGDEAVVVIVVEVVVVVIVVVVVVVVAVTWVVVLMAVARLTFASFNSLISKIFNQNVQNKLPVLHYQILTLILRRSRTGTVWFYTSTSNKRATQPKLYTKSLTRDLKLMYSRFTLVRISINL